MPENAQTNFQDPVLTRILCAVGNIGKWKPHYYMYVNQKNHKCWKSIMVDTATLNEKMLKSKNFKEMYEGLLEFPEKRRYRCFPKLPNGKFKGALSQGFCCFRSILCLSHYFKALIINRKLL